jgi:hypothetical protein
MQTRMYACMYLSISDSNLSISHTTYLHCYIPTSCDAERARTFIITASRPYMHKHTHEHKHTHAPGSPRHGRFSLHFFVTVQYLLRYTSTAAATEKARQSASARVCPSRNTARSTQSPPLPHLLTSPSFSTRRCVSATHTRRTHISSECFGDRHNWTQTREEERRRREEGLGDLARASIPRVLPTRSRRPVQFHMRIR